MRIGKGKLQYLVVGAYSLKVHVTCHNLESRQIAHYIW
jgi:hypothetical protein